MKCVKAFSDSEIKRVSDEKAHDMVMSGAWAYCPKSDWKDKVLKTKELVKATDEEMEKLVKKIKTNVKVKKTGINKGETK